MVTIANVGTDGAFVSLLQKTFTSAINQTSRVGVALQETGMSISRQRTSTYRPAISAADEAAVRASIAAMPESAWVLETLRCYILVGLAMSTMATPFCILAVNIVFISAARQTRRVW